MPSTTYRNTPAVANRRKPAGRPPVSETPIQLIEGEAYESITELVLYRDNERVKRLDADALCDRAVRLAQRALEMGDIQTAQDALRAYWVHDAAEDAAAQRGDVRVAVAHAHVRVIPAQCCELEMGAVPASALERGAATRRGGRQG